MTNDIYEKAFWEFDAKRKNGLDERSAFKQTVAGLMAAGKSKQVPFWNSPNDSAQLCDCDGETHLGGSIFCRTCGKPLLAA